MSAVLCRSLCGQLPVAPPIFSSGPYANDRDHSLSLLAATCSEQQGRFHTLQLLTEYLAGCAGRKRQIVTSEIKTLQELYESTWSELSWAFPAGLIRRARSAVEMGAAAGLSSPERSRSGAAAS